MRHPSHSLILTALAAATAVVYFVAPSSSAWYWQCPFHSWTGLLCPGCGGTRAVHALLHGDFASALRLNGLAVFVFVAFWAAAIAPWTVPASGREQLLDGLQRHRPHLFRYAFVVLGVFTLVRNLEF